MVGDFAGLDGTTRVYDLYTGTGAIALTLAPRAQKVVGIENVAPAIGDARENARINSIENVSFVVGDVREVLADRGFVAANPVDVVVVDPPRSGLHPNVVETLADMALHLGAEDEFRGKRLDPLFDFEIVVRDQRLDPDLPGERADVAGVIRGCSSRCRPPRSRFPRARRAPSPSHG